MSQLAHSFGVLVSNNKKGEEASGPMAQRPLQQFAMWANFDQLISRFNEDEIEDFNIGATNLIATIIQERRRRNNQQAE